MIIEIDFNSDEALYMQLRNQIILGIATSQYQEGEALPSVRSLADTIGINMHTVNKAYSVLKQEGFVKVDRRRGVIIAVDIDKLQAMEMIQKELRVLLAQASCKNISREEIHDMIDTIYNEYGGKYKWIIPLRQKLLLDLPHLQQDPWVRTISGQSIFYWD